MKKTVKMEKMGTITEKQIREIENAKQCEIICDEDAPEITEEMIAHFKKMAVEKRAERQKQVLTLRVSNETMKKQKHLVKAIREY